MGSLTASGADVFGRGEAGLTEAFSTAFVLGCGDGMTCFATDSAPLGAVLLSIGVDSFFAKDVA